MRNRIYRILIESINVPDIQVGDIVIFHPDAELTLSYENDEDFPDGVVPSDVVQNNTWISDGYVDEEIINVNCASSYRGAGDMCANGLVEDVVEVIRIDSNDPKRKQRVVWKKS